MSKLRSDSALNDRLSELADKAKQGERADAERAAYEAFIEANDLLAVLQAKARFFTLQSRMSVVDGY